MLNDCYLLRAHQTSTLDPQWGVADYMAMGFRRQGAERWLQHDIAPHLARHYAELGLSPIDAESWGVVPAVVEGYLNVGVGQYDAWSWIREGVMPDDVPRARHDAEHDQAPTNPVCAEPDGEASSSLAEPDPWAVGSGPTKSDGEALCTVVSLNAHRRYDEPPF